MVLFAFLFALFFFRIPTTILKTKLSGNNFLEEWKNLDKNPYLFELKCKNEKILGGYNRFSKNITIVINLPKLDIKYNENQNNIILSYKLWLIDHLNFSTHSYNLYINNDLVNSINSNTIINEDQNQIFFEKKGNRCGRNPLKNDLVYKIKVYYKSHSNKVKILLNMNSNIENYEVDEDEFWGFSFFNLKTTNLNSRQLLSPSPCQFPCLTCSTWLIIFKYCTSCYSGYYLSKGSCLQCESSCKTCSGPSSSNCTSCVDELFYLYSGSCLSNCPSQTYKNTTKFICSNCNISCLTCLNYSYCTSCISTYYLLNNQCLSQCPVSYYFNVYGICDQCDPSCLTCIGKNNNQCISCDTSNDFYLYQGTCLKNCPIGTFLDYSSGSCSSCDYSCKSCQGPNSSECLSCDGTLDLYLYLGSCLNFCPSETYINVPNFTCEFCDNTCLECSGNGAQNCTSCDGSEELYLYQSQCISNCPIQTYTNFTNGSCEKCDETCLGCSGNGSLSCISCDSSMNLYLFQSSCVNACPTGYFPNINTASCIKCDTTCLTCTGTLNNQCTSCDLNKGLFLYSNICYNGCPPRTFSNLAVYGNKCQNCDLTCQTCLGPNNNDCQSCISNYPYYYLNNRTCFTACPINTFLNDSVNQCQLCVPSCLTCNGSSSNNCLSCMSGLYLFNQSCIDQCPFNYYNTISNNDCQICDKTCNTCYGPLPNNCKSCFKGYNLSIFNECKTCQPGFYYSSTQSLCVECDSSCETCEGPLTNQCLTCSIQFYIYDGSCVSECPQSSFKKALSKQCFDCDVTCETCFGSFDYQCLTCNTSNFLNDNSCVVTCPIGKAGNVSNHSCYIPPNLYIFLSDSIDNPYYFLLSFYPDNYESDVYQNLINNTDLIINGTRGLSYNFSFISSSINISSFILIINYPMNTILSNTSNAFVTVNNSNNSINLRNNISNVVQLKPLYKCLNNQYFNELQQVCKVKKIIDYNWQYSNSQENIILIQFTELNTKIQESLLNWMLIFRIRGLKLYIDYNHFLSFDNNSNTLIYTYLSNSSIIGGMTLDINVNESLYNPINILNNTIHLNENNFTIKLFDYYILPSQIKNVINQAGSASGIGSILAFASLYIGLINNPGSSFALRGLTLTYLIQLLKYLEINYPPNAISIFKNVKKNMILSNIVLNTPENSEDLPLIFKYYGVSISFIENIAEDLLQLAMVLIVGCTIKIMNFYIKDSMKLKKIYRLLMLLEVCFIWNMFISIFFSKFLNFWFFTTISLRYLNKIQSFLATFVLLAIIIFNFLYPFHLIKISNKLLKIMNQNGDPSIKKNSIIPLKPEDTIFSKRNSYLTTPSMSPKRIFPINLNSIQITNKNNNNNTKIKSFENDISLKLDYENSKNDKDLNKYSTVDLKMDEIKSDDNMVNHVSANDIPPKSSESSQIRKNKKFKTCNVSMDFKSTAANIDEIILPNLTTIKSSGENELKSENSQVYLKSYKMNLKKSSVNIIEWNNLSEYHISDNKNSDPTIITNKEENTQEKTTNIVDWENMHKYHTPHLKPNGSKLKQWVQNKDNVNNKLESDKSLTKYEKKSSLDGKSQKWIWETSPTYLPSMTVKSKVKDNIFLKFLLSLSRIFIWLFKSFWLFIKISYKNIINIYYISDEERFKQKYAILIRELKPKTGLHWYYFNIYLLRIGLLSIITTCFYGYSIIQISLMTTINLIFTIFFIFKRPFQSRLNYIWAIINETCINVSYLSALSICGMDSEGNMNSNTRLNFGWVIMFSNLFLLYSIVIISLYRILKIIIQLLYRRK